MWCAYWYSDVALICNYEALLWFDFALTFTTEVQQIWRRRFSGAAIVYLLTRYSALLDSAMVIVETFVWRSSDKVRNCCSYFIALCICLYH